MIQVIIPYLIMGLRGREMIKVSDQESSVNCLNCYLYHDHVHCTLSTVDSGGRLRPSGTKGTPPWYERPPWYPWSGTASVTRDTAAPGTRGAGTGGRLS